MKPAVLRPQALRDQQGEVRYYRKEGGTRVAVMVSLAEGGSSNRGCIRVAALLRLAERRREFADLA